MDIRAITSAASGYTAARPATKVDPEFHGTSATEQARASFERLCQYPAGR